MTDEELKFWYGRNTNTTWRCEVRLKPLCDAFHEMYPHCTPAPGNRSSWYAGLRKILREFDEKRGVIFIRWAKKQVDQRNKELLARKRRPLDITDAHSIFFLHKDFKSNAMDHCPECDDHFSACRHEWGSKKRQARYSDVP